MLSRNRSTIKSAFLDFAEVKYTFNPTSEGNRQYIIQNNQLCHRDKTTHSQVIAILPLGTTYDQFLQDYPEYQL